MTIKADFKSLERDELGQRLRDFDEPAYRAVHSAMATYDIAMNSALESKEP